MQHDLKSKRMERSGLILEPSKAKGMVNLNLLPGDNGILFSMVDLIGDQEVPLGDCVIVWRDIDTLIEQLQKWRAANTPKKFFLDLAPGVLGNVGSPLK